MDAGESCGVFLGATTSVFDRQATDFWDIARDARIGVAANRTSENIAAQLSAFHRVVGNGAGVETVAEFVAEVFASEVLLTNLGDLSFDRQFGPVTLKAMFGPAVVTGFEGQQTVGVSTVNGACVYCIQAIRNQGDYSRLSSGRNGSSTTHPVRAARSSMSASPRKRPFDHHHPTCHFVPICRLMQCSKAVPCSDRDVRLVAPPQGPARTCSRPPASSAA